MKKKQASEQFISAASSTTVLFGHHSAEESILSSINSGKMPHALLLSGLKGIGKATFAYRIARFLFTNKNDHPSTLDSDLNSPTLQRIAQKSFSDLLVLEEPFVDDKGKQVKELSIHMVREIAQFLRLSASESRYRIVIIDSVDDMNHNAANALLKLLEEPPAHAYLLLISHNPGKILPTIRSRCRQVKMQPPMHDEAVTIIQTASPGISLEEAEKLLLLSNGSPGIAVAFAQNDGLKLYTDILECLHSRDMVKILKLAESLTAKENDTRWEHFCHLIRYFMETLLKRLAGDPAAILLS